MIGGGDRYFSQLQVSLLPVVFNGGAVVGGSSDQVRCSSQGCGGQRSAGGHNSGGASGHKGREEKEPLK